MGYVTRGGRNGDAILARVDMPQDVYEALTMLHTDCLDELGEDHPMTHALSRALDEVLALYAAEWSGLHA